jgi:hypothetical protein
MRQDNPMRIGRILTPALVALAAGCNMGGPSTGGSSTGDLANAVGVTTSAYAVLDLVGGGVRYLADIPDLRTNADYRNSLIAFRRVGSGSGQALIAVFELTQAQWLRIDPIATSPWTNVPTTVVSATAYGGSYPAFNLPADDLSTALAAFSPSSGVRLAIPTSAQWRAAVGATTGYSWGAQADRASLVGQAVVRETVLSNARIAAGTTQIDAGGPATVGSRSAGSAGIYDLHGNVWEWVDGGTAVLGGSWYDPASLARAETSAGAGQGLLPDIDHALIGARLVLIP